MSRIFAPPSYRTLDTVAMIPGRSWPSTLTIAFTKNNLQNISAEVRKRTCRFSGSDARMAKHKRTGRELPNTAGTRCVCAVQCEKPKKGRARLPAKNAMRPGSGLENSARPQHMRRIEPPIWPFFGSFPAVPRLRICPQIFSHSPAERNSGSASCMRPPHFCASGTARMLRHIILICGCCATYPQNPRICSF